MRRIAFLFLLTLLPLFGFTAHKFYVSITKIEYVQEKKSLQIISKVFIDDIEDVLQERYDKSIVLASNNEGKREKLVIEKYVLQKMSIWINGEKATLDYLGYEYHTDVIKIFIEVPNISKLNSFEVENTMLMELFPEQQNIIHFRNNDFRKSLVIEKENPKGLLKFTD